MNLAFVHDQFVPEDEARVSVFDRGFLYGDGLFETVRARHGQLLLWSYHADRLLQGATALGIPVPFPIDTLHQHALHLLRQNQLPDGLIRIQLTRGKGPRGYSPRHAGPSTLVITSHTAPPLTAQPPPTWRLHTAQLRLPHPEPIAHLKTTSKLFHILARAEADAADADDALLLNTLGHLVETSSANLFWLQNGVLHTPPLSSGALPGTVRRLLLEKLPAAGWSVKESSSPPNVLHQATGVFATLSTRGIVEIIALDHQPLARDPHLPSFADWCLTAMSDPSTPPPPPPPF